MIRVLIAEDHGVVRAGLEGLLAHAPDIEPVGVAANGEEAVTLAAAVAPDVVLMDLSMPVMDGIEATRRIRAAAPDARVVALTSFSDRERILDVLDAGAVGYLLKDAEPEDLYAGIRAAARDESPLTPKVARAVLAERSERAPAQELSDREREVLALVSAGLANKVIARRLGISEKTVKHHMTNIMRTLNVTDRTQAALWAQRHRIGS